MKILWIFSILCFLFLQKKHHFLYFVFLLILKDSKRTENNKNNKKKRCKYKYKDLCVYICLYIKFDTHNKNIRWKIWKYIHMIDIKNFITFYHCHKSDVEFFSVFFFMSTLNYTH